jgi:hypothetical protein
MSYQVKDESEESGQPVLLYEISVGTTYYRLTDRTEAITRDIGGQAKEFLPAVIVPDKFAQSNDIGKDVLAVKIAKDSALALEFLDGTPDAVIGVTVFRTFTDESETLLYWQGSVSEADSDDEGLTLNCAPLFARLKEQGLRALYMSTCRHQLYDDFCALYKENFATNQNVFACTGDTVRISAFSARSGYWVGGTISYNGIERTILNHTVAQSGDLLKLTRPIRSLTVWCSQHAGQSAEVVLYRGCDHTYAACKERSNAGRFGGFPWFRRRNPFTTSIIA